MFQSRDPTTRLDVGRNDHSSGTPPHFSLSGHEHVSLAASRQHRWDEVDVMNDRSTPVNHALTTKNTAYSDQSENVAPQSRRGIRLRPVSDLREYNVSFTAGICTSCYSLCSGRISGSLQIWCFQRCPVSMLRHGTFHHRTTAIDDHREQVMGSAENMVRF